MFQKIQPQQISLHTFSSPSGDLSFSQGDSTVEVNVSRYLTGDFNVAGDLSVNGVSLLTYDPSNVASGVLSYILGGIDNTIEGTGNMVVNGDTSVIYGSNNLNLNGNGAQFGTGSAYNTILAGYLCAVDENITGASMLCDNSTDGHVAVGSETLTISFKSGTYFQNGNVEVDKALIVYENFNVADTANSVFSGNLNVSGSIYDSSSGIYPKRSEFTSLSGNVAALNVFSGNMGVVSGHVDDLIYDVAYLSGIVSGLLDITNPMYIDPTVPPPDHQRALLYKNTDYKTTCTGFRVDTTDTYFTPILGSTWGIHSNPYYLTGFTVSSNSGILLPSTSLSGTFNVSGYMEFMPDVRSLYAVNSGNLEIAVNNQMLLTGSAFAISPAGSPERSTINVNFDMDPNETIVVGARFGEVHDAGNMYNIYLSTQEEKNYELPYISSVYLDITRVIP